MRPLRNQPHVKEVLLLQINLKRLARFRKHYLMHFPDLIEMYYVRAHMASFAPPMVPEDFLSDEVLWVVVDVFILLAQ